MANVQRPNIFEFLDYREFLAAMYRFRKREKSQFSFRVFARAAGLRSSNYLKLVIDGQRNLSADAIGKFAQGFKLTKPETNFFETLVQFQQAASAAEKNRHYERILQSKRYKEIKPLDAQQYAYFSNWYFVALRELVLLKGFRENPVWINKALGTKFPADEIDRALHLLIDLQLLHRDSRGRLRQTTDKISTTPELGSIALINFHREMLRKAADALESSRTADRDISALTVAISRQQFVRLRERITQFRTEMHALAAEDHGDREAVYQLNLQLFNLSEVVWK